MASPYVWDQATSTWITASAAGVAVSPLTTKGDVWGYSTTDARIPIGTDGDVLTADSTQTLGLKWAAAGGGGVSSLDSITGAITLVAGSNVTITDNTPSSGDITIAASGGGVTEYDYAQITSPVTITGTSSSQTTIIDGSSVSYDGSTRVLIEFCAPAIGESAVTGETGTNAIITLWDGSTQLAYITQVDVSMQTLGGADQLTFNIPAYGAYFYTPSSGSHTFHIKGWKGAGAPIVRASSGGAAYAPAWYRVTSA